MEQQNTAEALSSKNKKIKPVKALPTDRITFGKQIDLLRAYGVAFSQGSKPVANKEAAAIVGMVDSTTAMANAFYVEVGFLQRGDGGFIPSRDVIAFARSHEWDPDSAPRKLLPTISTSWFAQALMPRLSFNIMDENEAILKLAEAANAGPEYRNQIRLVLNYMEISGLVERDGDRLRAAKNIAQIERSEPKTIELIEAPKVKEVEAITVTSTASSQPKEGVIQMQVNVNVSMSDLAGWSADRISAFFAGIAQVLTAKGVEKKQD